MRSLLIAFLCLIISSLCTESLCAQLPYSPPAASSSTAQRMVNVPAPRFSYVRESLEQLFRGNTFADPLNANNVEIVIASGRVRVSFSPQEQLIRVEGAASSVADVASLVQALGVPVPGNGMRILPLNDDGQTSLAKMSRGIQVASSPFGLASYAGGGQNPLNAQGNNPAIPQGNLQPNASTPLGAPQTPLPKDKNAPTLPLPQFEGVQIEMLPEIDAVILRGRDQQLRDLTEIIKQLDEASRLSQPEIEVILLQHVSADAVAKLVTTSLEKLVGSRQGKVSMTSLGTPNALLLIGWGDAMAVAKELLTKLDQPASADAQFMVFQLKHAVASEVQTQLQGFYRNREGLGPVIQSMADPRTNAIVVYASPRDQEEIRQLLEKLDVPRGSMVQHARVFPMRYSLASDIAKALQQALTTAGQGRSSSIQLLDQSGQPIATSGILSSSQITVNERNNSIMVSSAPENLQLIEKLIEQLDTPGMIAKIKIFPIKNGDAATMVETLRALMPAPAAGTTANGQQLSNSPDENSLLPLRFTVDARGNSIIAVGSEGDLKIVEALIVRLDEADKLQRKSSVYQLKNSPAVDVALAINDFLRNKRQVEIAAPGAANPFEQLDKEVVVVPEPVQNKLILSATPRYYDEIAQLIEQLDQQPPQVMIQVMIAEITLGNTDEFGVEMGLQDSVLFDRSLLGGLLTRTNTTSTSTPSGVVTSTTQEIVAATNTPGFNFNSKDPLGNSGSSKALGSSDYVGGQGISNFSLGRANNDLGFGGLVLSASSENVSFLLRALQDSRRLEILSRPQVLTLDNQQAFIQVGQRVPRIVNSIINQNGAQNNVQLENVGLIIGVTPRISPEGNVVMEIDAEKSKLGPENEGIPVSIAANGTIIRSPRVDTITAQATVSAGDGETIILGGLISRSERTIHRQVPWLGSLPILKHLFSYDLTDFTRTELLIIMTPHVVRNQGDMERLKQAEFARMSWCEADVFEIHGDVYPPMNMTEELMERQDWNVVYPDIDPRGASTTPSRKDSMASPVVSDAANITIGYQQPTTGQNPGVANAMYSAPTSSPANRFPPSQGMSPVGKGGSAPR